MGDAIEPVMTNRELAEHRDRFDVWVRRLSMCALAAVVLIALFNVLGQRASTIASGTSAAELTVHSPTAVRPGLLFQSRISVTARQALPNAQLVLGSGWFDGLTLNTEEPGASTETSGPNGSVVLSLGSLAPGQTFVQYLEFQVNPTSFSQRRQTVTVRSRGADVASLSRTMTIVP
jgi:hypothetical protein